MTMKVNLNMTMPCSHSAQYLYNGTCAICMLDGDVEEIIHDRVIEIDQLRARVKQLEAAASTYRRQDSKRLALVVMAIRKLGYQSIECPGCNGEGCLFIHAADGDLRPNCVCPDCDGSKVLQLDDM
jgi:hypothetical protein